VYDDKAAEFSAVLYDAMLVRGLPVGHALLEARRALARYGIPFYWANSMLWGNPNLVINPSAPTELGDERS
jgi:CHAT domain-containing protein